MESALAAIVLGSLFAIVGGYFFLTSAVRVWRQWSILREGDTAPGTILAIEPTSTEVNNVRQWEVRYQYRDHFGRIHEGTSGDITPDEARAFAAGDNVSVRFNREHPGESVWDKPETLVTAPAAPGQPQPHTGHFSWKHLVSWASMLALVFIVIILGEIVIPIIGLDGFIARHESVLTATTVSMTALAFALFMGGILYRIFGGAGEPMSHADVEDLSRRVQITQGRPYFARVSTYRFKGKSAGSSFHDQFSIKEAKEAWRQREWRRSPRWRSNFVVMVGALMFALGLCGIVVVIGTNGIKFLFGAVIIYWAVRMIIAFARA
jgi:hypothetical protein